MVAYREHYLGYFATADEAELCEVEWKIALLQLREAELARRVEAGSTTW